MKDKVLVTGGTGFLGAYFLEELKKNLCHEIFLGTRTPLGLESPQNQVFIDLSQPINNLNTQFDIVFHIAGEKKDTSKMWNVNYTGTEQLLKWAVEHGVKKFVYLSSVGVYGAKKNSGIVTEISDRCPKNAYEQSKNAAELLVSEICETHGINYVILQPTNVIGIHRGTYPLLGMMRAIQNNIFMFFDDGSAYFNYISVEDVATTLVLSLNGNLNNRTFILNTPVTIKNAVEIISSELKVRVPTKKIPRFLGYLAGEMTTIISNITGKNLPFSRERYYELTNQTQYCGNLTKEFTEHVYPNGIEITLRKLAQYYKTKGLL